MTGSQGEGRGGARGSVIVISSHVARGSVGNRACVFALETLGHPVWAVPTVMLPWHPGHGPATRILPPAEAFQAFLRDLERAPWLGEVTAVLSGYLGEPSQADAVAALVRRVKAHNADALYLCDPVMGDAGGLYVPPETAAAIQKTLLPLADIATPNRYELAWLAEAELDTPEALAAAARHAGPATMMVTSVPGTLPGNIGNLLLSPGEAHLAEHRAIENPANGPGDLMAALLLAWILLGIAPAEALRRATAATYETLARAAGRGADELMLETDAASLASPAAMVKTSRFSMPGSPERA